MVTQRTVNVKRTWLLSDCVIIPRSWSCGKRQKQRSVSRDSNWIVLLGNQWKFCPPSGCTLCNFHLSFSSSEQISCQRHVKLQNENFFAFTLTWGNGQKRQLNAVRRKWCYVVWEVLLGVYSGVLPITNNVSALLFLYHLIAPLETVLS